MKRDQSKMSHGDTSHEQASGQSSRSSLAQRRRREREREERYGSQITPTSTISMNDGGVSCSGLPSASHYAIPIASTLATDISQVTPTLGTDGGSSSMVHPATSTELFEQEEPLPSARLLPLN